MTFALLAYRPGSVELLRCLLRYLRKEELKRQFAANTSSLILRALCPKMDRKLFSEFVCELEEDAPPADTRTAKQIIDDLIAKLGGDADGSIHAQGHTGA